MKKVIFIALTLLLHLPETHSMLTNPQVSLGSWQGFGSLAGSTVVCIENNASDQLLRLSNLDAHHEFSLRNGKYRIPIKVHYSGHHSKQAISPLKPFRLPPSNSKHLCHRGQPLALSFDIQAEQLYQFPAGKYQGNFVLMVYTE